MKIDRSRFLLLTSALSAVTLGTMATGGCSSSATNAMTDAGVTPDSATTPESSTADSSVAVEDSSADGAAACLGDTAPDRDGGFDCSMTVCSCASYTTNYRAAVADFINSCVLSLPTCESTDTRPCVEQALAKTCADPTATTFCTPLVTLCAGNAGDGGLAPLTQAACETLATGLSTAGRTLLTTCLTAGTANCVADPADCIKTLAFTF